MEVLLLPLKLEGWPGCSPLKTHGNSIALSTLLALTGVALDQNAEHARSDVYVCSLYQKRLVSDLPLSFGIFFLEKNQCSGLSKNGKALRPSVLMQEKID